MEAKFQKLLRNSAVRTGILPRFSAFQQKRWMSRAAYRSLLDDFDFLRIAV